MADIVGPHHFLTWEALVIIPQLSLTTVAFLGFGFYLWYLKSSDNQSQSRLLNILNGYLSLTCMGFSLTLFYASQQDEDERLLIWARISAVFVIAVSAIFLLISWATILNHFKPSLYLDISISWNHKIAIPLSIFAFILTEQAVNFSCPEKFLQCEVFRLRTMVLIPATLTSFICQLLVIVDDIWGWTKIYRRLRSLARQNLVSPASPNNRYLEQQPHYVPVQGQEQHLVSFFWLRQEPKESRCLSVRVCVILC